MTFTATITPSGGTGTATGVVTFTDGTTVLASSALNSSGVATLTLNTLALGTHRLRRHTAGTRLTRSARRRR